MDMCCYKKCCSTNTTWSSSCLQIKHHTIYMIQQSKIKPSTLAGTSKIFCCISFASHYKIQTCLVRIYKTTLTIANKSYLHPITFHASHETQGCIGYCMHFFPKLKSCEHRYFTRKTNVKKGALAVLSSDSMAHWFLIEYQDP